MASLQRLNVKHRVLIVLVFMVVCRRCRSESTAQPLHILGLFPLESQIWSGGESYLPAAEFALKHVNERQDVLPGYELEMLWGDSKCEAGAAVDTMYKLLYDDPIKIMVLGASCSSACQSTAQSARYWNLVQMSYACVSPSLSDKTMYPLFTRINPPDTVLNVPRLALIQEFGWRNIATITEAVGIWAEVTNSMVRLMEKSGIHVIGSESFQGNPDVQMKNIKKKDARIIVGNFYTMAALKVFCEAYKLDMYGAKYAWIIQGWYTTTWIDDIWSEDAVDCTKEEIAMAAEGAFSVGSFYLHPEEDEIGVSGLKPSDYFEEFDRYVNNTGSSLAGYSSSNFVYDSVWAMALALNQTMTRLEHTDGNKRLENFTYEDNDISRMILQSFGNLTFDGITGRITFDENGDALTDFKLQQTQGGVNVKIGIYRSYRQEIELYSESPVVWQGDGPPIDRVNVNYVLRKVPRYLYGVMCFLSVAGISGAVSFLVFNIKHRKKRIIKMSSPNINNVILCGCVFTYSTVLIADIEGVTFDPKTTCKTSGYLLLLGFSIAFGALFSKTWRVHLIFRNVKLQKQVVKDSHLLVKVFVLVCVDVITIALWELVDPLTAVIRETPERPVELGDNIYVYQVALCQSAHMAYWLGFIYSSKTILLLFGVFLAWETRKITVAALNDSRYIGICVYNVVILSCLGAPVAYFLQYETATSYGIRSALVITGTTVTQCLVFFPKVMAYNDGQGAHGIGMIHPTGPGRSDVGNTQTSNVQGGPAMNGSKSAVAAEGN
ncbi:gamma-aminobutyric acid type B receptor subunit 2-like [Ptychodera flava]|uniref:gamma-aminobutyric acid type B receptor subunit 2-like n=1 Tax=Ptychodera flava TaxID=63121 RepID=UPI00396A7D7D